MTIHRVDNIVDVKLGMMIPETERYNLIDSIALYNPYMLYFHFKMLFLPF